MSEGLLFRIIDRGAWGEVKDCLRDYPNEIVSRDVQDGSTPLHQAALNDAPMDIIDLLLTLDPSAARVRDEEGWTPLHVACFFDASAEIVARLIRADIGPVHQKDVEGRLPIHLIHSVMSKRWNFMVSEAMQGDDSSIIDPRQTQPPQKGEAGDVLLKFEEALLVVCRKAKILMQAAHTGQRLFDPDDNLQDRIVHAQAGIPECPESFMKMGVKINSPQLAEQDDNGNMPLHLAASNPRSVNDTDTGYNAVRYLTAKYPAAAAVKNADGDYPLHLALKSGKYWNEGVEALVKAFSGALKCQDQTSTRFRGLFPFMICSALEYLKHEDDANATQECDDDTKVQSVAKTDKKMNASLESLATSYQLLRAFPEIQTFTDVINSSSMETRTATDKRIPSREETAPHVTPFGKRLFDEADQDCDASEKKRFALAEEKVASALLGLS